MSTSKITHATAQGQRAEQQDRLVTASIELPSQLGLSGRLLAVMDGHGGSGAVDIAARELVPAFEQALRTYHDCILGLREMTRQLVEKTSTESSGSTLSVVFIPHDNQRAYVCILGDSPIMIKDFKGTIHISPLHNARCNLQERFAAIQRGARYIDGYLEDSTLPGEGLQMSRALGDNRLNNILNREPDVYSVPLGMTSWALLASDGVLDSLDQHVTPQLFSLSEVLQQGIDAKQLIEKALQRNASDNVSVIIWRAF